MTELKNLNQKRGSLKSQLTLFEKFINEIHEIDEEIINKLQQRVARIEPILDQFYEIQDKIELIDADADHQSEREMFQNAYFDLVSGASTVISKFKRTHASQGISNQTSSGSRRAANMELPRMNLPTFDGNFTRWCEFSDAFLSIIDANSDLSECQKFCYFRSALKGEPANMLRSLNITNANYKIAWDSLSQRYNNQRRIIDNHVREILNTKPLTKESHVELGIFINHILNQIQCLGALGQPIGSWDALLVPIILNKLDFQSGKEWETRMNASNKNSVPKFNDLNDYLYSRQGILETIASRKAEQVNTHSDHKVFTKPKQTYQKTFAAVNISCLNCQGNHFMQNCEEFSNLSSRERNERVKTLRLCLNCLRKGHFLDKCQSKSNCKVCQKRHHTMLHYDTSKGQSGNVAHTPNKADDSINEDNSCTFSTITTTKTFPILATAQVEALNSNGQRENVRILLDCASQSNFITANACKLLNLELQSANLQVKGITQNTTNIKNKTSLTICSKHNNYQTSIECFVISQIVESMPSSSINISNFKVPPNIKLADPNFNESASIDILIGVGLFYNLLCVEQLKGENGCVFQKTKFGWVVAGALNIANPTQVTTLLSLENLNQNLQHFWKVDEFNSNKTILTTDEQYCESHFVNSTTRGSDGRFTVRLPFKQNLSELGNLYDVALARFESLEKRLSQNETLRNLYFECMNDYKLQNHMSLCKTTSENSFFLPHHAVVKETNGKTKLRVVFDGSCHLDSGLSINELQYAGPTMQDDIFSIIARYRTYEFVIAADITQMYRQIWVHKDERRYQKILWRDSEDEQIKIYELNTVTFGMTSAPFLAIRCLFEVAELNKQNFSHPSKWVTFVANRVAVIQELTEQGHWFHVKTNDNPADIISRGVLPSALINCTLWWKGPKWLREKSYDLDVTEIPIKETPEAKRVVVHAFTSAEAKDLNLFHRFSNLTKLKRITALCLRFIFNCRNDKDRKTGHLTRSELDNAFNNLVRVTQVHSFSDEYFDLLNGKEINPKSSILGLAPLLDEERIIRVGGRLKNSDLSFNQRHPILLPKDHNLTKLIFTFEHLQTLHAGPTSLLYSVRNQFWPISGKVIAKQTVRQCVQCFRFNSRNTTPFMGDLPKSRVTPMPPFHSVGIDYAGPLSIKDKLGRGSKTSKCYVCLFICFATKAIHLEAVSSLTSEAFIATLRRFIARRGKPLHIYSDNGTNFQGANTEIQNMYNFLNTNNDKIARHMIDQNINWHFIPSHSPHFGGLWESGVKCTKHHLKRVMSNASLTFEDLTTILTQIESILNSRPLSPMSTDPNDLRALTPAHFLIGRPLTALADPNVMDISINRLSRFQYMQHLCQHFWTRWAKEYISNLQQRQKWKRNTENIKTGSLVLIKEDNLPPCYWRLGRVTALHPGKDNVVRVVTVKCGSGHFKRPVVKLCVLPIDI